MVLHWHKTTTGRVNVESILEFDFSLFQGSTMMSDMMSAKIPFIFYLLLADLTLKLFSDCVHIQNMLKKTK